MNEIVIFALTFLIGMVLIIPVFIVVIFYKKMPLPFWKKYRLVVYALPDGIEYNPNKNALAQIHEKDGFIYKEFNFWKFKEKGIIKYFVNTRFFNGFFLDYKFMPCVRNFSEQASLRLLQKKKDVWENSNFVPLDLPEDIDSDKFKADLSSSAEETHNALRHEMERSKDTDWWKEFLLPAVGMLVICILVFFTHMHNENMAKIQAGQYTATAQALSTATEANYYATCAMIKRQYGIDCEELIKQEKEKQNTTQPQQNVIPFTS